MKKRTEDLLQKYWSQYLQELHEKNLDFKQYKSSKIEKWAKENKKFLVVSDMATRMPIYETANMPEIVGFGAENDDFLANRANFVKRLLPSHVACFSLAYNVSNIFLLACKLNQLRCELKDVTCGLIYNHDTEGVRRLALNKIYTGIDLEGESKHIIICFEDVTDLFISDFYWIRVTAKFEDGTEQFKVYRSDDGLIHDGDLFSDQEKGILKALLQNNTINDVANSLAKSREDLECDLKNIVARVGAKDVFSLLELCRQNGLLEKM